MTVMVTDDHAKRETVETEATLLIRETLSDIQAVTSLSETRVHYLLMPWFGQDADFSQLTLPVVLEVKLGQQATGQKSALENLQASLAQKYSTVHVRDRQSWVAQVAGFLRNVQWVSLLMVVVILGITTAVVVLMTRMGLKLHARTIAVLHNIGARDGYIARQFQLNALLLSLKGGVVGVACAAGTFIIIRSLLAGLSVSVVSHPMPLVALLVVLTIVWLGTGMVATFAARIAVLHQLRQM